VIPVPIPTELVWPGGRRLVIGPPNGDPTDEQIRSVEAIVDADALGRCFWMRIELEAGDLEQLQADPHFWLVIRGHQLAPFDLQLGGR